MAFDDALVFRQQINLVEEPEEGQVGPLILEEDYVGQARIRLAKADIADSHAIGNIVAHPCIHARGRRGGCSSEASRGNRCGRQDGRGFGAGGSRRAFGHGRAGDSDASLSWLILALLVVRGRAGTANEPNEHHKNQKGATCAYL